MNTAGVGGDVVGIVLAAGRGSRMRSRKPKPLHRAVGKELIRYPVDLLSACGVERIVVVVSPDNRDAIGDLLGERVKYAVQPEPQGTGDALACGLAALPGVPSLLVVLSGDTPLVRSESVRQLVEDHCADAGRRMTILSATDVFSGDLGRIRRGSAEGPGGAAPVTAVIEAADLPDAATGPEEVNAGVYCFDGHWLAETVMSIPPAASGERYLTALAALAAGAGDGVAALPVAWPDEAMGVNDRKQLAAAETVLRDRINLHWMESGVTIMDTATTYIDADVTIGCDTVVLPNTMLSGGTVIGEDCEVGPNAMIRDTVIGDRCRIVASALEGARVESDVGIGPYSHLRPGSLIETGAHLGNYVEVKNSRVGAAAAVGHFSYLGDADIGAGANIGAGTITCNYDGVNKHWTVIGDGAFIGCDTMLVAPVTVGAGAATGAGAVVLRDVPEARLAVGVPAKLLPPPEKEQD